MSAKVVRAEALASLARAELARRRLADFLALLVPGYEEARHAESLCAALEALERREIRRLLVQMPPRHGKTLHVSQGFPAWWLGRHPTDSQRAEERLLGGTSTKNRYKAEPSLPDK